MKLVEVISQIFKRTPPLVKKFNCVYSDDVPLRRPHCSRCHSTDHEFWACPHNNQ